MRGRVLAVGLPFEPDPDPAGAGFLVRDPWEIAVRVKAAGER